MCGHPKLTALVIPSPNMSSTAAITDKPAANRRIRSSDRYFFSGMALLLLGTVLLGFAKTYFLAGMFHAPLPDWISHVHGAAFTLWLVLLIVQVALVAAHRTDIHRRLGLAGFGLDGLVVVRRVPRETESKNPQNRTARPKRTLSPITAGAKPLMTVPNLSSWCLRS